MVALITGSLLPESSVILTSRPSTEAPKRLFQRCCVVLGFEEEQVKEYTYKFYKNTQVADKVYDYILNNDSLFVLSFIPLYCYIICTAMAEFFSSQNQDSHDARSLELNPPRTVSEVYFCYLFTAVKHHALKGTTDRNTAKAQVLSLAKQQLTNLGKLAYENLLKKKIMFDRNDLEKYGVLPADVQSTFLCQILQLLKEETVEMYSFFHLTVQEHLAAMYCATNLSTQDDVLQALDLWCFGKPPSSSAPPLRNTELHMDKLEGLQMFTRFFMGMLRARLAGHLEGLVDCPVEEADGLPVVLGAWFRDQFKERRLQNLEALNLLHCLMEFHMEDTTSVAAPEIKRLNLFKMKLSVVDCAAMHYVLQFSPHKLSYCKSFTGRCFFLKVVTTKLFRSLCDNVLLVCSMCGNNLGPEGVLELWNALEHNATVEELYLDITGITERGTENIVNCLSKNTLLDLGKAELEKMRSVEAGGKRLMVHKMISG
uniref:Uncharacterized protein n=1 Tax=Neogobius melanostomus TaxID=47308 RepID=A0A8C6S520_9GOBI